MVGVEQIADALHAATEVRLELVGELLARRLVGRVLLMAERQPRVVHPAEILGVVVREQPLQKIDDALGRGRILTTTRGERPGDRAVERAINQRVAVDEKQSRR